MRMNKQQFFITSDLSLSAVLVAHGFVLDKVEKTSTGKSKFLFEYSENIEKLIDKYWKGKVKMNPQDIFVSLKVIKNRLYSSYS